MKVSSRSQHSCAQVYIIFNGVSKQIVNYIERKKAASTNRDVYRTRWVAWARQQMTWKAEWKQVLSNDEKKFNLDGPDGAAYN